MLRLCMTLPNTSTIPPVALTGPECKVHMAPLQVQQYCFCVPLTFTTTMSTCLQHQEDSSDDSSSKQSNSAICRIKQFLADKLFPQPTPRAGCNKGLFVCRVVFLWQVLAPLAFIFQSLCNLSLPLTLMPHLQTSNMTMLHCVT